MNERTNGQMNGTIGQPKNIMALPTLSGGDSIKI